MSAPEENPGSKTADSDFKPAEYRGVSIEREVAGRIGKPPGRPLYHYRCTVFGRRLVRISLDELKKAIDEVIEG